MGDEIRLELGGETRRSGVRIPPGPPHSRGRAPKAPDPTPSQEYLSKVPILKPRFRDLIEGTGAEPIPEVAAGLFAILVLVLVLPFRFRRIEENLEPFFLAMGLLATGLLYSKGLLSHTELTELFRTALKTPLVIQGVPIGITQVVLIAGLFFYFYHEKIYSGVASLYVRLGPKYIGMLLALVLGLTSSLISVIVAAVILAELVAAMPVDRDSKISYTVAAAFAIGMGAALTPVGEPLSTIAVSKLSGEPYHAGFLFLFVHLGHVLVPGIVAVSIYAGLILERGYSGGQESFKATYTETLGRVVERAVRVYMFVAALELLGHGFTPIINWYLSKVPGYILYWINMVSAVLDNATLTAAEIGPALSLEQIRSALTSLIISGGMLIPGNIPNIVAAGRLGIKSREWARRGVPLGIVLLLVYFVVVEVLKL